MIHLKLLNDLIKTHLLKKEMMCTLYKQDKILKIKE